MLIKEMKVLKISKKELNGKSLSEFLELEFGAPFDDDRFENGDDAEETFLIEEEDDEEDDEEETKEKN